MALCTTQTTSSWIKSVAEQEIMSLQILDIMVTTQLDLNYNELWEAVYKANSQYMKWMILVLATIAECCDYTNSLPVFYFMFC